MLLILNMGLYFFMIIISSWIINHGIVRSRESGESDSLQTYICSLKDWVFQAFTDSCMHALPCLNVYAAAILTIPARIFPIYFPMGNLATGFFVILSLLAGVVGFTSSVTGLYNLFLWNAPSIHATYASSLASLSLTLLAMGLVLTLSLSLSLSLPLIGIFLVFFFFNFQTHILVISCWCMQTKQVFSRCGLQIRMQRDQHRLDRFSLGMFINCSFSFLCACITSNRVSVNPLEPP